MVKKKKKSISRVKNLLDGYRLPHGYEIVIRKQTGAAKTRAAVARGERRRKHSGTKHKPRKRDSKGRFKKS